MTQRQLRKRAHEIIERLKEIFEASGHSKKWRENKEVQRLDDELGELERQCKTHKNPPISYGTCPDCGRRRRETGAMPPNDKIN